jgi:hypothetical protein
MTSLKKIDAANRQLDFAITLLFSCGDAVCVHTLAGAASNLYSDLVRRHAPSASFDLAVLQSNNLLPREYFGILRKTQNFLKHANSDSCETLDFQKFETEDLIMSAVMNSKELQLLSIPQSVYQYWYLASRAAKFDPTSSFLMDAFQFFPALDKLVHADQLAMGQKILAQELAD